MRIAFDAKRAFANGTGLGNYSRWVLQSLARHAPGNELIAMTPTERTKFADDLPMGQLQVVGPWTKPLFVPASLHRTHGWASLLPNMELDVFHGLSNELPYGIHKQKALRKVVTLHDVLFKSHPEGYGWIDRWMYDRKVRYALGAADVVVCVSKHTAEEALRFYGKEVPGLQSKLRVVYQGCDERFSQPLPDADAIVKALGITRNYVLCVGTIEPRKNQLAFVQAWKHTRKTLSIIDAVDLVLVGKPRGKYGAAVMADVAPEKGLHHIANADMDTLRALYARSLGVAYVSLAEGFGIPILEALASGVPVLTHNQGAVTEAGGDVAIQVDATDTAQLWRGLHLLALENDPASRAAKAQAHLANFSMQTGASQLMAIYQGH